MPRVPTKDQPGVARAANLPDQSPNVSADAFGAIRGRALVGAGAQLRRAGLELGDVADKWMAEDEQREAKTLDREYSEALRTKMFGDGTQQNRGYYSTQGLAAMEQAEGTHQSIETLREDFRSRASNEEVARMFDDAAHVRNEREYQSMARHYASERERANVEAHAARLGELQDDLVVRYNDPEAITRGIDAIRMEALTVAEQQGMDADTAEAQAQAAVTAAHASVIDRILAEDQFAAAGQYFEDHKDEIDGRQHAAIRDAINRKAGTRLTLIGQKVGDAVEVLEAGQVPSGLDELAAELAAVPGDRAVALENRLNEARAVQKELAVFVKQSPAEMRTEMLRHKTAAEGSSDIAQAAQNQRAYELKNRAYNRISKMISDGNGLTAAVEAGVLSQEDLVPIMATGAMEKRRAAAERATQHFGVYISPLTAAETDEFAARLAGDPANGVAVPSVKEQVNMMRMLNPLGEDTIMHIAGEVADKRVPSLGWALARAQYNPGAAETIAAGTRILQDVANKDLRPKGKDFDDEFAEYAGNVFGSAALARARGPMRHAIYGAYAAIMSAEGHSTGEFNEEVFKRAADIATGGILDYNGHKVFAPFDDWTEDTLEDFLATVSEDELRGPQGEPLVFSNGFPFTTKDLTDTAGLQSINNLGQYNLTYQNNGVIMYRDQDTGELVPFILDVRDLEQRRLNQENPITRDARRDLHASTPPKPPVGPVDAPAAFVEGLKYWENRTKTGWDSTESLWTPHESVEGGNPTLAYGHKLDATEMESGLVQIGTRKYSWKHGLTEPQAHLLLLQDTREAMQVARRLVPNWGELPSAVRNAVVHMAFNMGEGSLSEFKNAKGTGTLDAIIAGDYELAGDRFEKNRKYRNQIGSDRFDSILEGIRNL